MLYLGDYVGVKEASGSFGGRVGGGGKEGDYVRLPRVFGTDVYISLLLSFQRFSGNGSQCNRIWQKIHSYA